MKKLDKGVENYVSPRQRELTPSEIEIREVAYQLKTSNQQAIEAAAAVMAAHVTSESILVPIPDSGGSTEANINLCAAISKLTGAMVSDSLYRARAVESSSRRRQQGKPGIKAEDHNMRSRHEFAATQKVLFIDNVLTTGATADAARLATNGVGGLLAYAKAEEVLTYTNAVVRDIATKFQRNEVPSNTFYEMVSYLTKAGGSEQKQILLQQCGSELFEGKPIKDHIMLGGGQVRQYPRISMNSSGNRCYSSVREVVAAVNVIETEQNKRNVFLSDAKALSIRAMEVGEDPRAFKKLLKTNYSIGIKEIARLESFLDSDFAANEKAIAKRNSSGIKFNTIQGADYMPYVEPGIEGMTDAQYEVEMMKLESAQSDNAIKKDKSGSAGPEF